VGKFVDKIEFFSQLLKIISLKTNNTEKPEVGKSFTESNQQKQMRERRFSQKRFEQSKDRLTAQ
jgi:hypothetical protein